MKTLKTTSALAFSALFLLGQSASAAETTTTFQVTATVLTACAVTALPLAFGNYDPTSSTDTDATTTITVTCTLGTPYQIGLDAGTAAGATVTTRQMTGTVSSDLLDYSLFSDSGRTTNWGNTLATDTVSVASAGLTDLHTVYGRITASQNVTADAYVDTITVTVTY